MRKKLFNDYWMFSQQDIEMDFQRIQDIKTGWYDVELPHDWLIYDTKDLYQTGTGWYKKTFFMENMDDQLVRIYFEGVYMNSTLYVNGHEVGTWTNGYSSFEYNITEYLVEGKNTLYMCVEHKSPNSRWYSGAGIYRNVYLKITPKTYVVSDGIYIVTNLENGSVEVSTELQVNYKHTTEELVLSQSIVDFNGNIIASKEHKIHESNQNSEIEEKENSFCVIDNQFQIDHPIPWDLQDCFLYLLNTKIIINGTVTEEEHTNFGFRTIGFDCEEGFSLNGEYMKLKGVCLHHDLGSLGAAVNKVALRRQLLMMKTMGANAIRTSHNMPAKELMELCDSIGLLVVSEGFDMWEISKTKFDNGRFFSTTYRKDVASWIRRDRNHPSLIMWSIGNEIPDTHASGRGLEIARMLKQEVEKHDPLNNGVITIGSNYIAWNNAQKVAEELIYSGYNYGEYLYDKHHKEYPHWIIYGSETSSNVRSRGIYHFPASKPILIHDDLQCSSLDNSAVSWGAKSAEWAWEQDRDRKFCAGQFVWTGFDYIGEPTPYNTKNSYFGIVDTAGFPKDIYYMYQGEWTSYKEKPMVHILPYWDFNEGQLIDIFVYSNAPKVELFFNDQSMGVQNIDHRDGERLHGEWQLPYTKGTLVAKAYDEIGNVIAEDIQTSFEDPVRLELKPDKLEMKADGKDLVFVEISTVDKDNHFVANARNHINVEVTGAGRFVGLDNGDSTDYDDYKNTNRKLFSGKLMAIIQSQFDSGEINIRVRSKGLKDASATIKVNPYVKPIGHHVVENNSYNGVTTKDTSNWGEIPVRKIELIMEQTETRYLSKKQKYAKITAELFPRNASYSDLEWKIVNDNGVHTNIAKLQIDQNKVQIEAIANGDFRLRCECNNGKAAPEVISELEFYSSGLGDIIRNPYDYCAACYYQISNIPLNVQKNGAIGGIHQRTMIGFHHVDFGVVGSKLVRIYAGNTLGGSVPIEVWEGDPREKDSTFLTMCLFEVNGKWDSFLPMEYDLPVILKGKKDITFVIEDKITFGGFEFILREKAYEELNAGDYDQVYGDSYCIEENKVEKIGNNVVLEFYDMNFGNKGFTHIVIKGRTSKEKNIIHVKFSDKDGNNINQVIEFLFAEVYTERTYELESIVGLQTVSFVFLPGSSFDFEWFRFE